MSSLRYFLESKAVRCNPWVHVHVHDREHLARCLALHEALAKTIERYENQAANHTTSGQLTLRSEPVTHEGASLLPSAAAVMPSPPPRNRHFHAAPPPPPRGITTPTSTPTPTMTPTLTQTLTPTPTSPDAAPSPSRCIAASGQAAPSPAFMHACAHHGALPFPTASGQAAPSPAFHTAPMPPPPPRRHRHASGEFHATTLTPLPISPTPATPETRTMAESDAAAPPSLASQSARALAAALAAQGHVASRRGDAAAAARLFDEAYATAAGAYIALHVETIYERARYAQMSRDGDADMALALTLATELSSYLLSAANMHLEAGDWAEARTQYTQLLRHGPTPDGRFTMEAAIKRKCEEKLQALDKLQRDPASSTRFVDKLDMLQMDPEGGSQGKKKLISIPELKAQELWQSRSNQEAQFDPRAPLVGCSGRAPTVTPTVADGAEVTPAAAALLRSAESIEASALLLVRSAEAEAAALLRSAEAERERLLSTVESEVRLLTRSILIEEMHARFVALDDEAAAEQREMEREIASAAAELREMEREIASAEAEQREMEREIASAVAEQREMEREIASAVAAEAAEAAEAEVRAARAMAEAQAAEARAVQTAQLVLQAEAEVAAEVETAKATAAAKAKAGAQAIELEAAKAVAQAIELEAAKAVAQAVAQAIEEHAVAQAIELEAAAAKRVTEADELVSAARAEAAAVLAAAEERAAAAKQAVKADELVWAARAEAAAVLVTAARAEAAAVLVAAEERAAALAPSTPSCPSDETNRLRRSNESLINGAVTNPDETNRLRRRAQSRNESLGRQPRVVSHTSGDSRPPDEESNRLRRMASQRVLPANLKDQLASLRGQLRGLQTELDGGSETQALGSSITASRSSPSTGGRTIAVFTDPRALSHRAVAVLDGGCHSGPYSCQSIASGGSTYSRTDPYGSTPSRSDASSPGLLPWNAAVDLIPWRD
jgi:hypothetical protein